MKTLGKFLCVFVFASVNSIFAGYVASILWGWFVVPTFGLPRISVAIGIGIMYLLLLFTPPRYRHNQKEDIDTVMGNAVNTIFNRAIEIALTFLFGYVVHLFV